MTTTEKKEITEENEAASVQAEKNISNTPHQYICADTPEKRLSLITQLLGEKEVCFDTETTGRLAGHGITRSNRLSDVPTAPEVSGPLRAVCEIVDADDLLRPL